MIPHDLLRLSDPRDLVYRVLPPPWLHEALSLAPWVVVRRAPFKNELIPVGVRGKNRSERFAAFAHAAAVVQCVSPEDLASCQAWREAREEIPALRALPKIHLALQALGLSWGPVGSVGFELATAFPAANCSSDLDTGCRKSGRGHKGCRDAHGRAVGDCGGRYSPCRICAERAKLAFADREWAEVDPPGGG